MGAASAATSGFLEEPSPRWVSVAPGVQARQLIEGAGTVMYLFRIEAGTLFDQHRHSFPELGVILSGEGYATLEGGRRVVRAGDSYYYPPGVRHGFEMPPRGEPVVLVDVSTGLAELEERPTAESVLEIAQSAAHRAAPLV